jgi:bacillithiol system protein YtxJ
LIELNEETELATLLEASSQGPVFVLKHSTTCPISAGAFRRVNAFLEEKGDAAAPFYLVKVIESRPLSNAIARDSGVQHASPQLILFNQGKARWDTSHGAITAGAIEAALAEQTAG